MTYIMPVIQVPPILSEKYRRTQRIIKPRKRPVEPIPQVAHKDKESFRFEKPSTKPGSHVDLAADIGLLKKMEGARTRSSKTVVDKERLARLGREGPQMAIQRIETRYKAIYHNRKVELQSLVEG
jgi:seryl-tRNA synthetase